MTSQTSFNKPPQTNAALFAFKSAFSVGAILVNVLAFLCVQFFPLINREMLIDQKNANPDLLYCLIPSYKDSSLLMAYWIAQGMLTAVCLFGFMHNKRASAAYLALPVKRLPFFTARYTAGLIMLFVPHILFMLWNLHLNLSLFGYSPALLSAFFMLTAAILVAVFSIYSVTVAVCLRVGTLPEGIVLSFLLLYGAIFVAVGINALFSTFLNGNTLGEWRFMYPVQMPNLTRFVGTYLPGAAAVFLIHDYGAWSLAPEAFSIPFLLVKDFGGYFTLHGSVFTLLWLVLSVGISVLAGKAFVGFKAENAGSLGANPQLNAIGTLCVVFFMFTLAFSSNSSISVLMLIPIALACSLLAYGLCRFLQSLDIKKAVSLSGLKEYLLMLAVTGSVILVAATGFFGYSQRVPDLADIEYAEVTYPGAYDFIPGGGYGIDNYFVRNKDGGDPDIITFNPSDLRYTTANDLQIVRKLHEQYLQAGVDLWLNSQQTVDDPQKDRYKLKTLFVYKLKNGRYVQRLYKSATPAIAEAMLALDNTDAVRAKIAEATLLALSAEQFEPVLITDYLYGNANALNREDIPAFLSALQKDINQLSLTDKYYANQPAEAVVLFPRISLDGLNIISQSYATYYDGDTLTFTSDNENKRLRHYLYANSARNVKFFISEPYENTLAFLKEKGLWASVNAPDYTRLQEMYVQRYRINPLFETVAPYFRAYAETLYRASDTAVRIDPSEYADILAAARSSYYTAQGGYLVKVLTESADGQSHWVTLFLPEENAPARFRSDIN